MTEVEKAQEHSQNAALVPSPCELESLSPRSGNNNDRNHDTSPDAESQSPHRPAPKRSTYESLGWLDRLLALWLLLAIVAGILLGNFVPRISETLQRGRFANVSAPLVVGLLLMMYPIMCKVRVESLHLMFRERERIWTQLTFSVVVNWIVAPFLMLGLGWAFLPDQEALREGLVLVGLARCIAMVMIWIGCAGGDEEYGAVLVALNSVLQVVLYAPLAVFFIRVIGRSADAVPVDYEAVATSVGVFLGLPLAAAIVTRVLVRRISARWYEKRFLKAVAPVSLIGLLYTVLILFALQGRQVVHQIVSVIRVAAPMIVYFAIIFVLTLLVCRRLGFGYKLSATQSFTAASNNFELAIAVAVATFGADSDQALATTVGPLVEVPVLVSLVYVVKWLAKRTRWPD